MIKNKLLQIRLQKGFKYAKDFAKFLEISPQQYNRYECNKSQPTLETAHKIARKLNITIDEIIDDDPKQ